MLPLRAATLHGCPVCTTSESQVDAIAQPCHSAAQNASPQPRRLGTCIWFWASGLTSQQKVCQITLACNVTVMDTGHCIRRGQRACAGDVAERRLTRLRLGLCGASVYRGVCSRRPASASKGVASAGRSVSRALELASSAFRFQSTAQPELGGFMQI